MTLTDAFDIRPDDLSHPDVANLLRYHLANMAAWSPEESCHALDLDGLRGADIDFYCAWRDSELAGCGALKRHADGLGEIKSMITAPAFIRQGVAARMLTHLIDRARHLGLTRVSLETGSPPEFEPARRLYERFGFDYCEPFADYRPDPYSVFMTRAL